MKFFIFTVLGVCMFCTGACSAGPQDELQGTWLKTGKLYYRGERTSLTFKGDEVSFKNIYGYSQTVKYQIQDTEQDGRFTLRFEFTHKETRGNGRVIDRNEIQELKYHKENGMPILSETAFEYDGRGIIIMGEYLREKDLKDEYKESFKSELKHKLNDCKAVPMYKKIEE